MVDPRVQKAVEGTLDLCDLIITPRRWSTKVRRAYVMTFPVSFPALGIVNLLIMTAVILAAAGLCVLSGLLKLFEYLKHLWVATDE